MFVRNGSVWSEQAKLYAADGAAGDHFGTSVALSGDTVLIGAEWADDAEHEDCGAAYVFTRNAGQWGPHVRLAPTEVRHQELFGAAVALSGDTAVVGARDADNASASEAGAAFVFIRDGGLWQQQARLSSNDSQTHDGFAWEIALFEGRVLIGARRDGSALSGNHWVGSAYVFDMALLFADGLEDAGAAQ